jgi:hypothetical protein
LGSHLVRLLERRWVATRGLNYGLQWEAAKAFRWVSWSVLQLERHWARMMVNRWADPTTWSEQWWAATWETAKAFGWESWSVLQLEHRWARMMVQC